MRAARLFAPVLLLLPQAHAVAQRLNYIHYNTNNSKLPHDIIYQVKQAGNGYLWIATDDGLIGYDGTEMKEYNKGLHSRYVIATDEEHGKTWISTWKGGIHVMENNKIRHLPADDPWLSKNTNDILVYDDIVIGYDFGNYTVFRYDRRKQLLIPIELKQKKNGSYWMPAGAPEHYGFIKTKDHRLLAYNATGVYSVRNKQLHKIPVAIVPDEIRESPSGKLYLRKGNRIYRCSNDLTQAVLFYEVPVRIFGSDPPVWFRVLPSGNLCLAFKERTKGRTSAFYLVNRETGTVFDLIEEIGSRSLAAYIFVDNEGNMWLSTDGDGLYHIFDWKYRIYEASTCFRDAGVTAMGVIGSNNLYIGTKRGLYHCLNGRVAPVAQIPRSYIFRIFGLRDGRVACNIEGFDPRPVELQQGRRIETDIQLALPHYLLESMFPRSDLLKIRHRQSGAYIRTVNIYGIAAVIEDDRRRIWIGTSYGLFCFDPKSGLSKNLYETPISSLAFVPGSGLWIGTQKGLFVREGKRIRRTPQARLAYANVRGLYSDGRQSLWIGTQKGLYHLEDDRLSVFRKRDGLVADDVVCIVRLNEKEIAVGSSKGFTIVPLRAQQKPSKATLFVEKMLVDGRSVPIADNRALPHSSRITLQYGSTTFIYPELLQFRYRLNRNEEWIETQNKSLLLSNLKPGDYELELSVKKYNSTFSKPVLIRFSILPPWWRSWPFILLVIVSSALLSGFFFRLQLLRQRRLLRSRQELSELKMKALQAQLNPHFVSNALSVIQYYVLTRNELAVNRYLGLFSDLTRLFLEVSRKGLIALKTELELLEHYIELEQMRFEEKIRFTITVAPDIDPGQTAIPGLLVQPLVENSIHHGLVYLPHEQQGVVSVTISRRDDDLEIAIEDNGIGRSRSQEIRQRSTHAFESRSGTILQELCATYNSQPGCHIDLKVEDLFTTEGKAAGTRVLIRISGFNNNTLKL